MYIINLISYYNTFPTNRSTLSSLTAEESQSIQKHCSHCGITMERKQCGLQNIIVLHC